MYDAGTFTVAGLQNVRSLRVGEHDHGLVDVLVAEAEAQVVEENPRPLLKVALLVESADLAAVVPALRYQGGESPE